VDGPLPAGGAMSSAVQISAEAVRVAFGGEYLVRSYPIYSENPSEAQSRKMLHYIVRTGETPVHVNENQPAHSQKSSHMGRPSGMPFFHVALDRKDLYLSA